MQNQEYTQLFSDAEYGNTVRRSLAIPILSTRIKQRDSSGEIMDKEKYRHSWPVSFCLCLEQESNRRHRDFQSLALPTELSGQTVVSTTIAGTGFEPVTFGL